MKCNFKNIKNLADIKKHAVSCALCHLYKTRTPIFGTGNENAKIIFIGEAPGANEEAQGKPFVGRAGMLLNKLLKTADFNREDVYITNVLKCRPPNNRKPTLEEVKLCFPYLQKEIELIQPKIIVALGLTAAQFLLNTKESMENLRSHIHQYGAQKITLLVTYHPAYLLRIPEKIKEGDVDFLKIKKIFEQKV